MHDREKSGTDGNTGRIVANPTTKKKKKNRLQRSVGELEERNNMIKDLEKKLRKNQFRWEE